jgi:agmatinase
MGLPLKQDFAEEDFCIVGVPFDTATTNRPGCRFGPRAIREFMGGFSRYNQDADYQYDNLSGMDYGDISVLPGYTEESLELIYEGVKTVLDAGVTPIVLGGDHLITYAELRAYCETYGPVAMIHFDSHNDTSDYSEKYSHGTPFRRAIEDGFLDPTHSIQVGIRGYIDTYRMNYAAELGMEIITARELHRIGITEAARRIREQVGDTPCIVTFDIDFLDPAAAPGTGTPVTGGFTTYEAMELLRQALPGLDIKGFDMVEVMEDYDPGHITALAASHIIVQFLVALSKNKEQRTTVAAGKGSDGHA